MIPTEPLQLNHSWLMAEADQRFDLGHLHDDSHGGAGTAGRPMSPDAIRGTWSCELAGNRLHWSRQIYRLFGLPDHAVPTRCATVALYAEASRAAMERLRAHAIRHRRGFTLDVAIFPHGARQRWMRLIAAPVCEDGRVVRLRGLKSDVSHLYIR